MRPLSGRRVLTPNGCVRQGSSSPPHDGGHLRGRAPHRCPAASTDR
jgi:hypothetical protein